MKNALANLLFPVFLEEGVQQEESFLGRSDKERNWTLIFHVGEKKLPYRLNEERWIHAVFTVRKETSIGFRDASSFGFS